MDLGWKHIGDPLASKFIVHETENQYVVIELASGKPIHIEWSLDGQKLLVETTLGIDVLDGENLEWIRELEASRMLNPLDGGKVAALRGDDLVFIDLESGRATKQWTVNDPEAVMAISPDGLHLASATGNRTFDLIHIPSGEIRNLEINRRITPLGITEFVFSPDSASFFVTHDIPIAELGVYAFQDGARASHLFSVETGDQFYEIMVKAGPIFSSSGSYTYMEGSLGIKPIRLAHSAEGFYWEFFDASVGGVIRSFDPVDFSGYNFYAQDISFKASADLLGVYYLARYFGPDYYNRTRTLILYDPNASMEIFSQGVFDSPYPLDFGISPNGSRFFSIGPDGLIHLWDTETFELLHTSTQYHHAGPPSISPSGNLLAMPYRSHFEIRDPATLELLASVPYQYGTLVDDFVMGRVTFLSENILSVIVNYQTDGGSAVFTYDLEAGEYIFSFFPPVGNDMGDCIYSTNGATMACWAGAGQSSLLLREVYDTVTGDTLASYNYVDIMHHALSNDGNQIAYCSEGAGYINIVPVVGTTNYIHFPCQDMVLLPGDTQILLANGTVVDLQDDEMVGTFEFAAPFIEFPPVYFSPNRDFALIGNDFYDLDTGALLASLDIPSEIYGFILADDGLNLILLTARGLETWVVLQ